MKKLTKSDFWTFVRSNFAQGSWNMERMQALGFCFGIIPIIKRLYTGEDRKQALKRHLEFYNTQPFMTAPVNGVVTALEEQKANGKDINDGVINGIKVGMMGPLAGVGDPIFLGNSTSYNRFIRRFIRSGRQLVWTYLVLRIIQPYSSSGSLVWY